MGMKKYRPFIVLFVTLILPILVYVTLKLVATQNYRPIEMLSEKIPNPDGSPDSVFKAVGNFSLVTQTGDLLTLDSLRGKIWIANLFYGSCTDACDMMNGYIKQMLKKDFVDNPNVRFVSFSIDPERDSLPSLQAYSKRNEAPADRWQFLTGEPSVIRKYITEELKYPAGDPKVIESNGLYDRTFRLIDWDGHLRGEFYSADSEPPMVTMAQHIVLLLKEFDALNSGSKAAH